MAISFIWPLVSIPVGTSVSPGGQKKHVMHQDESSMDALFEGIDFSPESDFPEPSSAPPVKRSCPSPAVVDDNLQKPLQPATLSEVPRNIRRTTQRAQLDIRRFLSGGANIQQGKTESRMPPFAYLQVKGLFCLKSKIAIIGTE